MRNCDQRDCVAGHWWKILLFAGIYAFLSSRQDSTDTCKSFEDAKIPEFLARDYYDR
jgi:hypothetical protein